MNKAEKKVIKQAREEMDENAVSNASFKIQSILEELFQQGIAVGETIGYAKAVMEHADMVSLNKQVPAIQKEKTAPCGTTKTRKGCKK